MGDWQGLARDPTFATLSDEQKREALERTGAPAGFIDEFLSLTIVPEAEEPAPSYAPPIVRGITAAGDTLARFVKGAAKETPLVAMRAADLSFRRPVHAVGTEILERLGATDLAQRIRDQEALAREQMEEPFRPTGEETTAESVGRAAAKAAPTVGLAAATGGTSLPVQAATLGTAMAAQSVSERAPAEEVAISGVLGTAAPLAGPAVAGGVRFVSGPLKRLAIGLYNRALHPTKEATKTLAEKVVPELVKRGVAGSIRKIGKLTDEQVTVLGKEVGLSYKAATAAGKKVDAVKVADALENLKVPFTEVRRQLNQETGEIIESVVVLDRGAVEAINDLQTTLRQLGKDATPSALWKFRRVIDGVVDASNGFTRNLPRGTSKWIKKRARIPIRNALNDVARGVKGGMERLNAEYNLWKGAQRIVRETERRTTGQQKTVELLLRHGVGRTVGGAAGGAYGYRRHGVEGAAVGAIAGTLTVRYIAQMLRSPVTRTWSAVELNALADILAGSAEVLTTPAGKTVANTMALFGIQARAVTEEGERKREGG